MAANITVFISHSNEIDDQRLVYDEIIPKLECQGINIVGQDKLLAGSIFLSSLTELINTTDKTLLFVTNNSIRSPWCDLELLIGLERSQKKNQLSVVLLIHDISEEEIPQIAVLQEAPKIKFIEGNDSWVSEAVVKLTEKETIKHIMPAGNVAHGLVWSHFAGFSQYVLPELESKLKEHEWYNSEYLVSTVFYEMVPRSCTCHFDLSKVDTNIKVVTDIKIGIHMRGGNERLYNVKLYSVTDGDETYYFMAQYPSCIATMKAMEDNKLAKFDVADKKLQLARFYYTMNSVLNHFDNCRGKARVLLFNDETEKISKVLVKAIKEDLHLVGNLSMEEKIPAVESLETKSDKQMFKYQVFVAHASDDKQEADEIIEYLEKLGINSILKKTDENSDEKTDILIEAIKHCRWFIFLMTKTSLKDKMLQLRVLSALHVGILNRTMRVIPVVNRREDLYIPEALQWVTYVPFNENKSHLRTLHNIVSGEDLPLKTELLLPAGDVANGLAWGYVANYLTKILPDVLKGLEQAFIEKKISQYRCPEKLFIIIPKSCNAGGLLKDQTNRLENFTKTADFYPFTPTRPFSCQIYKVSGQPDLYFVGQYAAPVTCLNEMREWAIAGVSADTMEEEAERFYEIVGNIMQQADPEKAKYCEFIFYDDSKDSLADIMTEKSKSFEVKHIQL